MISKSLELLSLVSKVTSELQNHLGVSEKTLAEFVIAQHSQCVSLSEFQAKLEAMGAEFPQRLIESIDRLVRTMHPKFKGKAAASGNANGSGTQRGVEEKTKVFKGLALPDRDLPWEDELNAQEMNGKDKPGTDAIAYTLALLEGLESKSKAEKTCEVESKTKPKC